MLAQLTQLANRIANFEARLSKTSQALRSLIIRDRTYRVLSCAERGKPELIIQKVNQKLDYPEGGKPET